MKHCNTCDIDKPIDSFGKRSASPDGLSPRCKSCQSEYDKKRANKPSRVTARKAYAKTPAGIEAGNRAKKKYCENNKDKIADIHRKYVKENPKKRSAHKAIEKQVRLKLISIEPCEKCGALTVSAHHDDYDKPLDIRWLCSKHHRQWHAENGEGANSR